ncbi:hypothetical protein EN802_13550 [bacterium M00.F.Ca.ET.159.01.1.1]|nr:hypothetical protein EN802_13550 [bacterium M00.F.Ca.ET.159.01.1.1]
MSSLVVIGRGCDREQFLSDVSGRCRVTPIVGLPRHFLVDDASDDLGAHPSVESIEDGDKPAYPCDQSISIDSTLATGSWALPRIIRRRAPWNVDRLRHPIETYFRSERDGTGVDIYIVDTGIDIAHSVFGGRASIIYEFYSSGGANDDVGHGTGVASCAAGDVVGIARGATLFGLKIGQAPNGVSSTTALTTALGHLLTHYAGRTRPAVCNISYLFSSTAVLSAIADVIDAGIAVCGPAGNSVTDLASINVFPAEAPDAVCVAGLGMADIPYYGFGVDRPTSALTFGTNYGSSVSIMAPAQGVKVAAASVLGAGSYFVAAGTSYASPMAAGVIACMLQDYQRPTTRTQVQAINAKLFSNATTGHLRNAFGLSPLPDRILYLDPNQVGPEPISGLIPSLYRMAASVGSFALTGVDATLLVNLAMTADFGSFVLTGIAATLGQNPSMTADVGTFVLTGEDASFVADLTMTAAQGSFTLTGNDAALGVSSQFSSAFSNAFAI